MKMKVKLRRILCKLGFHKWTCEYVRYWGTYFRCKWCNAISISYYTHKNHPVNHTENYKRRLNLWQGKE